MEDNCDKKIPFKIDAVAVWRILPETEEYKRLYSLFQQDIAESLREKESLKEMIAVKAIIKDTRIKILYAVFDIPGGYNYFRFLKGESKQQPFVSGPKVPSLEQSRIIAKYVNPIYKNLLSSNTLESIDKECIFTEVELLRIQIIERSNRSLFDLSKKFPILIYTHYLRGKYLRDAMEIECIIDGIAVNAFYAVIRKKEQIQLEFLYSEPALSGFDFTSNNPEISFALDKAINLYSRGYFKQRREFYNI